MAMGSRPQRSVRFRVLQQGGRTLSALTRSLGSCGGAGPRCSCFDVSSQHRCAPGDKEEQRPR